MAAPPLRIVECPRDAFQGLPALIPTAEKIAHLRRLIRAGISDIDFGSFVSPKAVPQMADTEAVLRGLYEAEPRLPVLIGIIANQKGLDRAIAAYRHLLDARCRNADSHGRPAVGYPFSLADAFQRANTGMTITESWPLVAELRRHANDAGIELIVYLSMAFGNPYNEPWSPGIVADAAERLADLGVETISLADTVGLSPPRRIDETIMTAMRRLAARGHHGVVVGAHLHARSDCAADNIRAAFEAGCRRFDVALGGYGGCPFAQDELVGNVATERVLPLLADLSGEATYSMEALEPALRSARAIFDKYSGSGKS